jgi:hypothetical protein
MPLTEDDDVIEPLASDRSDEPLGDPCVRELSGLLIPRSGERT